MEGLAVPSLEHISTVKIAVTICQQDDVKGLMLEHFKRNIRHRINEGNGDELISKVLEKKVNDLPIYEHFIPELSVAVKEIKSRYFSYCFRIIRDSDKNLTSDPNFIKNVMDSCCWTCEGTVNSKESAHRFLRNEARNGKNLRLLFELACKCWLEKDVKFIWMKLSQFSKDKQMSKRGNDYCILLYWLCAIDGNYVKFLNYIKNRKTARTYGRTLDQKLEDYLFTLRTEVNLYMFAFSIFHGFESAVKYFYDKLTKTKRDSFVDILRIYLSERKLYYRSNEITFFLFKKLNFADQKIVLKDFFLLILNSVIDSWQCRRYTLVLIGMYENDINTEMYYKIFNRVLQCSETDKNAFVLLKKIWCNIPNIKKKELCNFVVVDQDHIVQHLFWKLITPDIFNWFLKVDDIKESYSTNIQNLTFKILKYERYDIVNLLLDKCASSDRVLIKQSILLEKGTKIFDGSWCLTLTDMNKFLNWAIGSEKLMENFLINYKKQILQYSSLPGILSIGIKRKMWKDITNFLNFFVNDDHNANEFVEDLNALKRNSLAKLFGDGKNHWEKDMKTWNEDKFGKHFVAFLNFHTSDEQISKIMSEIKFGDKVWSMCGQWMKACNWKSLENFVKWCSQYGKVTWNFKNEVLRVFLSNIQSKCNFWRKVENCEKVKEFLYWGCPTNNAEYKREVWEIKKKCRSFAVTTAFYCIKDVQYDSIKFFLPWYFEEGSTDSKYSKTVSSFKLKVARMITEENCRTWEEDPSAIKFIFNWNEQDDEGKKQISDVKKFFIENYRPALKEEKIKNLILTL